jgi:hypothetical protein
MGKPEDALASMASNLEKKTGRSLAAWLKLAKGSGKTRHGGRLEAAGSFNSMCTHRIRVEDAAGVDAEVLRWLRKAYDGA